MPFTALSAWLQCAEFNGKPGVASFKKIKKKKEKPANYLDGMQKVLGLFIVAKSEVARFHIYTAYICCIYGMKLCVLYIADIYCIYSAVLTACDNSCCINLAEFSQSDCSP